MSIDHDDYSEARENAKRLALIQLHAKLKFAAMCVIGMLVVLGFVFLIHSAESKWTRKCIDGELWRKHADQDYWQSLDQPCRPN